MIVHTNVVLVDNSRKISTTNAFSLHNNVLPFRTLYPPLSPHLEPLSVLTTQTISTKFGEKRFNGKQDEKIEGDNEKLNCEYYQNIVRF